MKTFDLTQLVAVAGLAFLAYTFSACSSGDDKTPGPSTSSSVAAVPAAPSAKAYLADARAVLDSLVAASVAASDTFAKVNIETDAGKQQVAAVLAPFAAIDAKASALRPPAGMEEVQKQVSAASALYRDAATLLAQGVQSFDLDKISQASVALSDGVAARVQASIAVQDAAG
jgi:hypothetical protein